jgi:hypothetical protein
MHRHENPSSLVLVFRFLLSNGLIWAQKNPDGAGFSVDRSRSAENPLRMCRHHVVLAIKVWYALFEHDANIYDGNPASQVWNENKKNFFEGY